MRSIPKIYRVILVVLTSSITLTACGSTASVKPEPAGGSKPIPSVTNPCSPFEKGLMTDKTSLPVKAGVTSLHDLKQVKIFLWPSKLQAKLGPVTLYCSGLADYGDLANVPVIFATGAKQYVFFRKWDYRELLSKTGAERSIVVMPKDRACQIPQDHFNSLLETLNSYLTATLNWQDFVPVATNLINNLEGDTTVIANETTGSDSSYIPLLIAQIHLGWTQWTLQNVSQGFLSSVVKFGVYCEA